MDGEANPKPQLSRGGDANLHLQDRSSGCREGGCEGCYSALPRASCKDWCTFRSPWCPVSLGMQQGVQRTAIQGWIHPHCPARSRDSKAPPPYSHTRPERQLKAMKTPRAEQDGAERGDPNLGEATRPWLSRQCHLLPLHTHPHPTLQCWGWALLGGEPRCFEAVAELLFPSSVAFRWELQAQRCGRSTRRTCSPSPDITTFSPSVNPPNVPRFSLVTMCKVQQKGPFTACKVN